MADPLSLATSLVEGLISRVKHVKVNTKQCQLLANLAKQTLSILQQLEERVFDSSITTSLELVVGALTEADVIVKKCCKTNFLFAALYHEDYSLALKQAAKKLEHALSQIPLASLGMTVDIQSDLDEIRAQICNAKFEEKEGVAHQLQGLRDALERAFNQTSQGTNEVKALIQELVQEHISSKEELRNELVGLKQFAFEANQNKERLQEFELNQIISVISESLGEVNEVPRITHDLEECYLCPISKDIMRDPVVLKDSCMIYDRSSIAEWLRRGHRSDPLTNIELVSRELVPNRALRKTCQIILEKSGGQSSVIPSPPEEEEEVVEQHIEPGLYEGQGKFLVGSSIIHTSQVLVLGPNGKVVGCTLYAGEILGVKDNGIDIGAGEWDSITHEFSFGDCQFNYNGSIQLKTNVHQRGIEWSGRVSKGDSLDEEYKFSLVYYPPFIGHEIPAYPTILEMESKAMKLNGDISCHSKAVLSLERDSSVDGWITCESACLESKRIGFISRGSWNENGLLAFSIFFPSNDTPLNSDSRPTNYEACFNVAGMLTHGQTSPSPSFSGVFTKAQEQGALQNVKAIRSPLDSLKMLEYPVIREASTPWQCLLHNPLKIFNLSRNFELERSQYAIREKFATHYGPILHCQRALGISPLHVAAANNSINLAKELIAQGAEINLTDSNGQSPLHYATFNDSIDVIKLLISKGAKINIQDKQGRRPLQIALDKNIADVNELFDYDPNIDLEDTDGWSKLHHASYHNDIDIVKKLISKGASIDLQEKDGRTPLYIASYNGHINIVKELIINGADVNLQKNSGASPLDKASYNGHADIVKELIINGADVNLQDNNGWTPMHNASSRGLVSIVKILLEKGASKEIRDNGGKNPYDVVCIHRGMGPFEDSTIRELQALLKP